jgi:hypothetical protein
MGASSYDGRSGFSLGWLLAVAVILFVVTSGAVAIGTSDKCGPYAAAKEWNYLPPHWVCR